MADPFDGGACLRLRKGPDGRTEVRARTPSGTWVRLHSLRDPAIEARTIVDRALNGAPVPLLVIVIGIGTQAIVDEVIRRRSDARLVALELLDEVPAELQEPARQARADGDGIVMASGPVFQLPAVAWPAAAFSGEPVVIVQPIAGHHWPLQVEAARRAAKQYVYERRANEEARERLAPVYLAHTLQNLPELLRAPDVTALEDIAAGDPLVLCGAGPSLDRQLPALRAGRNHAWLVVIDTGLRPLLAAGIVPDLVLSIDPTTLNGRHLLNLPTRERPWLVAESSLDPHAVRAFAGRTFMCRLGAADPWPWLESLGISAGKVSAWGSVFTAACDVVRRMRPARVAFAALDLAYTNGQPYCRGTAFEEDWEAQRQRDGLCSIDEVWHRRIGEHDLVEIDIHGVPIRTAPHLVAFRNWARAFVAADRSYEYANTTDAGILHGDGIVQCGLEEWLVSTVDGPNPRPHVRLAAAAAKGCRPHAAAVPAALETAAAGEEPWHTWAGRVPRIDRDRISIYLRQAARELRPSDTEVTVSAVSEWIDVPYDPSNFFAQEPMIWQVAGESVGTFAYRTDGKTMMLSFKINRSTLTGEPSPELYIRLPGSHLVARGAANAVWLGSPAIKEMGYITVHPGHDFAVVHRSNEQSFLLESGYFFVFGQLLLEVQ